MHGQSRRRPKRRVAPRNGYVPRRLFATILTCAAAASASPAAAAPVLTTLASFNGANGADPVHEPIIDFAGNLYGTTNGAGPGGTVYELSGPGHRTFSTVVSFRAGNGFGQPGPLTLDLFDNLYGTTSGVPGSGGGVAYRLSGPGHRTLTTLAWFGAPNGIAPAALTFDVDVLPAFPYLSIGLYGATAQGGAGDAGTLFELSEPPKFGALATIYSFTGRDAVAPTTRLVLDTAGNLFGTTTAGLFYYGSVFELSGPLHRTVTVLTRFTTGRDGGFVFGGLAIDTAGNLYGTASAGGLLLGGTIYELPGPDHRTVRTLFDFDRNGAGGHGPESTLLLDAAGNLFGTNSAGGIGDNGTIFRLSADHRTMTVLHRFAGFDGSAPVGGLAADRAGNLYGTTSAGGPGGSGTVFELTGSGFVTSP